MAEHIPSYDPSTAASDAHEAAGGASIVDRAVDAALELAVDGPWRNISLRDIAIKAGVPLAELYARAPGKRSLVRHLAARYDAAALRAAETAASDPGDRLFEAVMARLEAMEPNRFALMAIFRDEGPITGGQGLRLGLTARALLEGAGVDAGGRRGPARLLAMTAVWIRVLQVWRDDEGALNRTMAEIDRLIKQMRRRLDVVGAGF